MNIDRGGQVVAIFATFGCLVFSQFALASTKRARRFTFASSNRSRICWLWTAAVERSQRLREAGVGTFVDVWPSSAEAPRVWLISSLKSSSSLRSEESIFASSKVQIVEHGSALRAVAVSVTTSFRVSSTSRRARFCPGCRNWSLLASRLSRIHKRLLSVDCSDSRRCSFSSRL